MVYGSVPNRAYLLIRGRRQCVNSEAAPTQTKTHIYHGSMALMFWKNQGVRILEIILESIICLGLSELDWMSHARSFAEAFASKSLILELSNAFQVLFQALLHGQRQCAKP